MKWQGKFPSAPCSMILWKVRERASQREMRKYLFFSPVCILVADSSSTARRDLWGDLYSSDGTKVSFMLVQSLCVNVEFCSEFCL